MDTLKVEWDQWRAQARELSYQSYTFTECALLFAHALVIEPVTPIMIAYYAIENKIKAKKVSAIPTRISPPLLFAEDNKLCCICLDMRRTHITVPCGHYAYCENCIRSIPSCSICMMPIDKKMKVYD